VIFASCPVPVVCFRLIDARLAFICLALEISDSLSTQVIVPLSSSGAAPTIFPWSSWLSWPANCAKLRRIAAALFEEAGAPPEALVPLMTRTIENRFELTGPIARGDWETVERHRAALNGSGFEAAYEALAEVTRA